MLQKYPIARSCFAAMIVAAMLFVTPALAKKPHRGHGHSKGHNSHGFGHVSIGPYGFDVGYIGKSFGVNVGPFWPGFSEGFGPVVGPGPEIGFVPPPIVPVANLIPTSRPPIPNTGYGPAPGATLVPRTVVPTVAGDFQSTAETAFRRGHYTHALRLSRHALLDDPNNGKLKLFVSQVLFALEDYPAAVDSLQAGIAILGPRDWGYVIENLGGFSRNQDYVMHMNRLVQYIHAHPADRGAKLLRGYHYLFLGHVGPARRDLEQVASDPDHAHVAHLLLNRIPGVQPVLETMTPGSVPPESKPPVELLPTPALRPAAAADL